MKHNEIEKIINEAFENIQEVSENSDKKILDAISETIELTDKGNLRVAEKKNGNWLVNLNLRSLDDRPPSLWNEGAVGFPYDYYKDGKVDMKKYKEDMSHSFEVEPVTWEANIERLFYRIDPNDNKIGKVSMLWENIIIQFDVDTMTEEHLERFAKTLE